LNWLPDIGQNNVNMTKIEIKVVVAWREAAAELGFQFTSPFLVTGLDGERFEALGLVHQFGGRIGMLISADPSADVYPKVEAGYGVSYLAATGYVEYNRALWIEMLGDWGFWGEPSASPTWYSPGPHCHKNEEPNK
jgi:hypothetical protein